MISVSKLLHKAGVAHKLVTARAVKIEIRRERDGRVFRTLNSDQNLGFNELLREAANQAKKIEDGLGEPVFVHLLRTDFVLKNGALVPAKHHARKYAETNRQKREDF